VVARRAFREDLYYRLNVLAIRAPSLPERRDDIPLLARHVCERTCRQYGLPWLKLTPAAERALEVMEWPGNVRELAHAVEAATIRAAVEAVPAVERRHLLGEEADGEREPAPLTFQEAMRRFQRNFLLEALEATSWNVSETARRLDLARSYVYDLIQTFELRRGDGKKKAR
jgi:DNA-binding NtrC family response regulator